MPTTQNTKRPPTSLHLLLAEAGRTGRWVSTQLDVSEETVSKWRNGLRPPEHRQKEIARLLSKEVGRRVSPKEIWS